MDTIKNPKTGRLIKIGSQTHKALIKSGLLDRDTLDIGKKDIVAGSRQKMPVPKITHFDKCTHFSNVKEIADAIGCNMFMLIDWFTSEFTDMKICYNAYSTLIIFPQHEYFIDNIIDDFIAHYSEQNKLDMTYWNQ